MLKVTDLIANDTITAVSLVKVYEKPIAALQVSSVAAGCMPLNTSFEDFSNTNTSIVSWQWDFGDGGASNIQNPNYIYISNGQYSVSLSVVDVNGCESLATEIDLVEVNIAPLADFSTDITFSCNSSESVLFSNNSIDASMFIWDFGDQTTQLAALSDYIAHTYHDQGEYTIQLVSQNSALTTACNDTAYGTIKVEGYDVAPAPERNTLSKVSMLLVQEACPVILLTEEDKSPTTPAFRNTL